MAPLKGTCERIQTMVLSNPAIDTINDFRAHYIGQDIEVELHATIAAGTTFEKAHEIETDLTDEIQFTKSEHILSAMDLSGLEKSESAIAELSEKGMAPE